MVWTSYCRKWLLSYYKRKITWYENDENSLSLFIGVGLGEGVEDALAGLRLDAREILRKRDQRGLVSRLEPAGLLTLCKESRRFSDIRLKSEKYK